MTVTSNRGVSVDPPQRVSNTVGDTRDDTFADPVATPGDDTLDDTVESIVAQDVRVRKRVELGLSPRRPTAKAVPHRPPDSKTFPLPAALLPFLLAIILVATILLLIVNVAGGFPYAPQIERIFALSPVTAAMLNRAPSSGIGIDSATQNYRLQMGMDFSQEDASLAQGETPNAWSIELVPDAAEYRMTVWPNRIAWSMLGIAAPESYRFQASGEVDSATPWGYVGLVNRYHDEDNFYLFGVDGRGHYSVQLHKDGELQILQEWSVADYLNPAGSANVLIVDDDGETLRFFGNNMLLYEIDSINLALGSVGLVGGASGEDVAEVHFDWVQLYETLAESR